MFAPAVIPSSGGFTPSNPTRLMLPAPPQPTTAQNAFLQLQNLLLQQHYQQQQQQPLYFTPSLAQAAPTRTSASTPFPQLFLSAPQTSPVAPVSSYSRQYLQQSGINSSPAAPIDHFDHVRRQARHDRNDRRESRRRHESSRKRKRSQYENNSHGASEERDRFNAQPEVALQLPFDQVVVDTNQLILNLGHISSLQQYDEKIKLIVPVTVVNELDHMKTQNRDPELRTKAQQAISFLDAQFKQTSNSNSTCWIKLQTRDHVYNVMHGGAVAGYKENNDDRILDCALYYHHADPASKLALLTEDKNLSLKARCSSLQVVDCRTLLSKLPSVSLWKRRKLTNNATSSNSSDSEVASSSHSDDSDSEMKPVSPQNKTDNDNQKSNNNILNNENNPGKNNNNTESSENQIQTELSSRQLQQQQLSPLSMLPHELLINGVLRHLAPCDLLAMQVVDKRLGAMVHPAAFDWSDRLRQWSGDAQGKMIPSDSASAKSWYINWRRTIVPRQ